MNGWPAICTSSRARRSPMPRARPLMWLPPSKLRRRRRPNLPSRTTLGAARHELERQDRQCASVGASHRFARRFGCGRVRREPANGAHPQAGRPQQSIRDAADSRVESQASPRAASQGHDWMRPRSRTLLMCCTTRRCWRRAANWMIPRFSYGASTGSSWKDCPRSRKLS